MKIIFLHLVCIYNRYDSVPLKLLTNGFLGPSVASGSLASGQVGRLRGAFTFFIQKILILLLDFVADTNDFAIFGFASNFS